MVARIFSGLTLIAGYAFIFSLLASALADTHVAGAAAPSARIETTFVGVPDEIEQSLRAALSIEEQKASRFLNDPIVDRLHKRAGTEIIQALQPFGYYRPSVDSDLAFAESKWIATYRIELGVPVIIRELDVRIEGAMDDAALNDWRQRLPLRAGDTLRHDVYEQAKTELLRIANARGYREGHFTRRTIRVFPNQDAADIALIFDTGPRYRFGKIEFAQTGFAPEFLQRFLPFKTGDPYDNNRLMELYRSYASSAYFAATEVRVGDANREQKTIPVLVRLETRKRYRYTAGAGYGTDTGARIKGGFENRRLNSRGHRLLANLLLSEIRSIASVEYRVPLKKPASDYFSVNTGYLREDSDTANLENRSIGARWIQQMGPWQRTLGLSWGREQFDIGATKDQASELLLAIGGLQRVRADDRMNTRNGWRLAIELKGALEAIASDTDLAQVLVQSKYVHATSERGKVILRGDIGITSVDDFSLLPPSLRFFAGGDTSLRGYRYQSLGPVDSSGEVVGGKHLAIASLEYEHRLDKGFSLAAFYDYGNAFNELPIDAVAGAGLGLRWRLPIGALRLDVAFALDRPGNPARLHLTIGPDL